MAGVTIENLVKKFGKKGVGTVLAVNNVSFEIIDKELIVLLGPSGCGKTTILRCVAGLEKPDSGDIRIGDESIIRQPPQKRDVAMVFQSYALYPHLKVFDNIAMPLKVKKFPRDEIEKRVKETSGLLRIGHLLDRRPGHLSGGERQRVALGRAIIRQPKVFLMDEPLSNLDAKLRVYMRAELKRLQKELKTTMIFVTHDQAEAMSMADRIAIMNRGEMQQLGTPEEIYNEPTSVFVGGFIGSPAMNFMECTYNEKEEMLDAGNFTINIDKDVQEILKKEGSEFTIGIRPDDVLIHEKSRSEFVESTIYVLEPIGPETIVNLNIGTNLIKARVSPDRVLKMGDTVWLEFPEQKTRIFNRKTGKLLI